VRETVLTLRSVAGLGRWVGCEKRRCSKKKYSLRAQEKRERDSAVPVETKTAGCAKYTESAAKCTQYAESTVESMAARGHKQGKFPGYFVRPTPRICSARPILHASGAWVLLRSAHPLIFTGPAVPPAKARVSSGSSRA
jgi:hypothetical protein